MNLMTLQRYKNELILLLTLLFVLVAFLYKISAHTYVKENQIEINQKIVQMTNIINLKKQWGGKGISKKIKNLKTLVPESKVKSFKKAPKKLSASYKGLTVNELSKVTNKLINIDVQISQLKIQKNSKNNYGMEFICKW